MHATRPNPTPPSTATTPGRSSWIPSSSTNRVAIDPACWSNRRHQVALWRAMDGWYRQRRAH